MDSVRRAIGIDNVDMSGKMVVLEEQHGSNGNFLVNTMISYSLAKGHGICLVLFHNTFGHYHNIGMKLGYNLNVLRECGEVTVIEPMKMIVKELGYDEVDASSEEACKGLQKNIDQGNIPDSLKMEDHMVHYLFHLLKTNYYEATKIREKVTIIIDDLSHLFDMNLTLTHVWTYVKFMRSLMQFEPKMSLCIMIHTYRTRSESCQTDLIVIGLRRMCHLSLISEPLDTGHANDISGKMTVAWRVDSLRRDHNWPPKMFYLYKLLDRQVKIFLPGTKEALS